MPKKIGGQPSQAVYNFRLFGAASVIAAVAEDEFEASMIVFDLIDAKNPKFLERFLKSYDKYGNIERREEVVSMLCKTLNIKEEESPNGKNLQDNSTGGIPLNAFDRFRKLLQSLIPKRS